MAFFKYRKHLLAKGKKSASVDKSSTATINIAPDAIVANVSDTQLSVGIDTVSPTSTVASPSAPIPVTQENPTSIQTRETSIDKTAVNNVPPADVNMEPTPQANNVETMTSPDSVIVDLTTEPDINLNDDPAFDIDDDMGQPEDDACHHDSDGDVCMDDPPPGTFSDEPASIQQMLRKLLLRLNLKFNSPTLTDILRRKV